MAHVFQTSMNNIRLFSMAILYSFLVCSCNEKTANNVSDLKKETPIASNINAPKPIKIIPRQAEKAQSEIIPDTTINAKLKLNNYESFEVFYKDYKHIKTVDRIRESPIVPFSNTGKTQYLFAYQYEGNSKNAFSCFEIGHMKDNSLKLVYNDTNENSFETESGIHLGMSINELIETKGKTYNMQPDSVLTYHMDDYQNSLFLKKYNMPGYFLECRIVKSRVANIKLGFDYP